MFRTLRSPMSEDQLPRPYRDGYGLLEVLEVLREGECLEERFHENTEGSPKRG